MARPKKGTPEGDEALRKFRETMKKRYGDTAKFYKEIGKKGGENGKGPDYKGGFAYDREKAVEAGRKGGKRSKAGFTLIGKKDGKYIYENNITKEIKYEEIQD